jgi:hypothetical protein
MTTVNTVRVSLSEFPTIQQCREKVDDLDKSKSLIVVSELASHGKYVLPLIDRWLKQFPGRVFVDAPRDINDENDGNALNLMDQESIIRERLPEYRSDVCWSGTLVLDRSSAHIPLSILNPTKFDRLPQSENLFILARGCERQWDSIPASTNRAVTCVVNSSDAAGLDHSILISPSLDGDCLLFLMTLAPKQTRKFEREFLLRPIPNPTLFSEMYKSAVSEVSRVSLLQQPTYIRALALGTDKLGKDQRDTIMTRKQLNVYRTVEKIEECIFPFFATYQPPASKGESSGKNFESSLILKRMQKRPLSQESINKVFVKLSAETESWEDNVYMKKRFRRLFGTSFNSHKWECPASAGPSIDGPLASEVIGSL